jgi:hypothetical protein
MATHRTSLHNLLQRQIHPRIARNQVSVQCLAVLELDEHRVALRRCEESKGKLWIRGLALRFGEYDE